MKHKTVVLFALCVLALVVAFGCGEDFSLSKEELEITALTVAQPSIGVGETTTVEASVYYSGDETALEYEWTADGGTIGPVPGSEHQAVYIAPESPGTYAISLRVMGGNASAEETVEINVVEQSLVLDRDTHWPAVAHKDKLAYNVNVKKMVSGKVLLHYDITQDQDEFDAFLSIQIDATIVTVPEEMAIGAEQPSTEKRTIRDIDVSHVIKGIGRYMITFYIRPGDRVQNGWLLNEARIVGVQGTSDPQQ